MIVRLLVHVDMIVRIFCSLKKREQCLNIIINMIKISLILRLVDLELIFKWFNKKNIWEKDFEKKKQNRIRKIFYII